MQISRISVEGLKQEYKILIPAQDINKSVEDRLKLIGKSVKIPGFRPGMVPDSILKQRYGGDTSDEVIKKFIQNSVSQIIKDNSLKVVTAPELVVISEDEGKDFECNVIFETLPSFKLENFNTITLDKLEITITDEQVEKHLKEVFDNHKVFKPADKDRLSKEGDFLHIDIEATIDGAPFKGILPHYHTVIGSDDSVLSGEFERHLVGRKVGEKFEVKEIFPSDFKVKNLANQEVIISAMITKIEEPKIFKLDNDFAKEFKYETLDILKEKLRDELTRHAEALEKTRLKRFLLDSLHNQYAFDLPDSLVESEFQTIWKRLQEELESAKADGDLELDDDRTEEEVKDEYRAISQRRVRLGLIITEVADLNNIKITNADVTQAITNEVSRYPGKAQEVYEYYKTNKRALEALLAPVMEDKVVDFILSQVTLSKRPVDLDTFMKEIQGVIPGYEIEEEDKGRRNNTLEKKSDKTVAAKSSKTSESGTKTVKKTATAKKAPV